MRELGAKGLRVLPHLGRRGQECPRKIRPWGIQQGIRSGAIALVTRLRGQAEDP